MAEKHAINSLRKNDQIIAKPADKGGALVIWPREAYIVEANKQHYKLVKTDSFPQLIIKTEHKRTGIFSQTNLLITEHLGFYLLINQLGSLHYTCFLKYINLTCREDQLSRDARVPPSGYQNM